MDMTRIANVCCRPNNPAAGELYVSRLWLE